MNNYKKWHYLNFSFSKTYLYGLEGYIKRAFWDGLHERIDVLEILFFWITTRFCTQTIELSCYFTSYRCTELFLIVTHLLGKSRMQAA